ncbi:hypothetical protein Aduo_007595 [Ancylostoma duodenale]
MLFQKAGSDKVIYSNEDYLTTWKALEKMCQRREGLANFNHKQIESLMVNCTIKPALLQVECHPYFQQKKLRTFCSERGIMVNAYSSLEGDPNVLTDPVMKKIAEAHKKSTAQVALRWAVQQNIVVIPKSTREQSIRENADLFDFQLTDEEMKAIDGMDRGWRILHLGDDADHPLYPFSEEY